MSNGGVNGDLTYGPVTFLDVRLVAVVPCMDPVTLAWKDKTRLQS